jgi:hypothetical protein
MSKKKPVAKPMRQNGLFDPMDETWSYALQLPM